MRFTIDSFGCTMNHGEAELFRERLLMDGHEQVNVPSQRPGVNILFTCVVIQETERRMLRRIRELTETEIPLIVSGCLVTTFPEKVLDIDPDALLIPPRKLSGHSGSTIEQWLSRKNNAKDGISLTEPSNEFQKLVFDDPGTSRCTAIVPISQGCLGNCSYCITRYARGTLMSYPLSEVVRVVTEEVQRGRKEIQLTSQDTGIYGRDIGSSLPELLIKLSRIPGEFRIRVGMMNPAGLTQILDELTDAYLSNKIYSFLHMPLQSGDDEILRSMKRGYTVREAEGIVDTFRRAVPDLTLSTDIITGFPGEDERSFDLTMAMVERLAPDLVNITRFSERPGTDAVDLGNKVHGRISKERSRKLTDLRFSISKKKNATFIGSEMKVLVTEKGREWGGGKGGGRVEEKGRGKSVICRDDNYRTVVIKQDLPVGEWVDVRIIDSTDVYLLGELR